MVLGTQISNGIADDQRFPHEEVEEAIDDAGAMQQRRHGPAHGIFAQPRFEHFSAKLSGCALIPDNHFLEGSERLTVIDRTGRAAQSELTKITGNRSAIGVGPSVHERTSCPGISRAIARRSSVASF